MLRVILGIAALTVLASGTAAIAGGKISYGSRASMIVTVLSMSGLDTERAVIRTKHTREDAVAYCRDPYRTSLRHALEVRLNCRSMT